MVVEVMEGKCQDGGRERVEYLQQSYGRKRRDTAEEIRVESERSSVQRVWRNDGSRGRVESSRES
jgi:hypothetical protein